MCAGTCYAAVIDSFSRESEEGSLDGIAEDNRHAAELHPPLQEWQTAEAARLRREAAWQRRSRSLSASRATAGALADAARALNVDAWAEEREIRCWQRPPLLSSTCADVQHARHMHTGPASWHPCACFARSRTFKISSLREQVCVYMRMHSLLRIVPWCEQEGLEEGCPGDASGQDRHQ